VSKPKNRHKLKRSLKINMKIEKNKNISIGFSEEDKKIYIQFIPYNRELNLNYIKYWLKRIIKDFDDFVLYANGFNFDGLYETNKDLIKNGVFIGCNYTNNFRELKTQ